jgi:hypothetical protein
MADFVLVSQRSLEDHEKRIFRYHFLLGADWRLCCWHFRVDRGTYFHLICDIENRLGRVFAELAPYPLYPVAEYFSGRDRYEVSAPSSAVSARANPSAPRLSVLPRIFHSSRGRRSAVPPAILLPSGLIPASLPRSNDRW